MLKNAVLLQTDNNEKNKTLLLASKVRYGDDERFVASRVIHENQDNDDYKHELVKIKNADLQNGRPGTTGAQIESASTIIVIKNTLFASGFDKNSENNTCFPIIGENGARSTPTTTAGRVMNSATCWNLTLPLLAEMR